MQYRISLTLPFALVCLLTASIALASTGPTPDFSKWKMVELVRFQSPEATQGVAADADYIYPIATNAWSKYDRKTLEKVGEWRCDQGKPIIHFNSGIVHDGKLVLAHSNYPEVPMTGSVEWFDPATLEPVASHSFGSYFGSVTWVVRHQDAWWVCFAHYGNRAAEPNRDPTWTSLVRFDDAWRRTGGWVFPEELMAHLGGQFTLSGGAFGPGGYLYVSGHDEPELYVLQLPQQGSILEWKGTIAIPAEGQAFAWDTVDPHLFYCIIRSRREVVQLRLDTGA